MMGGAPGGHGGLQPPSAAAPGAAAAYTAPPPTVQGPCRVALLIEVTEAMAGLWPEFRAGYVDPVLRACELGGPVEVAVITFGSREAAFSGGAAVESSGWLSSIAEVRQLLDGLQFGGGGRMDVAFGDAMAELLSLTSMWSPLAPSVTNLPAPGMLRCHAIMLAVSEANRRPVVSHLPPKQPAPPLPPTPNTMPHSNPLAANYLTCRPLGNGLYSHDYISLVAAMAESHHITLSIVGTKDGRTSYLLVWAITWIPAKTATELQDQLGRQRTVFASSSCAMLKTHMALASPNWSALRDIWGHERSTRAAATGAVPRPPQPTAQQPQSQGVTPAWHADTAASHTGAAGYEGMGGMNRLTPQQALTPPSSTPTPGYTAGTPPLPMQGHPQGPYMPMSQLPPAQQQQQQQAMQQGQQQMPGLQQGQQQMQYGNTGMGHMGGGQMQAQGMAQQRGYGTSMGGLAPGQGMGMMPVQAGQQQQQQYGSTMVPQQQMGGVGLQGGVPQPPPPAQQQMQMGGYQQGGGQQQQQGMMGMQGGGGHTGMQQQQQQQQALPAQMAPQHQPQQQQQQGGGGGLPQKPVVWQGRVLLGPQVHGPQVAQFLFDGVASSSISSSFFSMWPPDLVLTGRIPSQEIMAAVQRRHPSLSVMGKVIIKVDRTATVPAVQEMYRRLIADLDRTQELLTCSVGHRGEVVALHLKSSTGELPASGTDLTGLLCQHLGQPQK